MYILNCKKKGEKVSSPDTFFLHTALMQKIAMHVHFNGHFWKTFNYLYMFSDKEREHRETSRDAQLEFIVCTEKMVCLFIFLVYWEKITQPLYHEVW